MATFTFQLRQRDADLNVHTLDGRANGNTLTDAIQDALKQAYFTFTGGATAYGHPGTLRCRGPYTVTELHIVREEEAAVVQNRGLADVV